MVIRRERVRIERAWIRPALYERSACIVQTLNALSPSRRHPFVDRFTFLSPCESKGPLSRRRLSSWLPSLPHSRRTRSPATAAFGPPAGDRGCRFGGSRSCVPVAMRVRLLYTRARPTPRRPSVMRCRIDFSERREPCSSLLHPPTTVCVGIRGGGRNCRGRFWAPAIELGESQHQKRRL